jgi:hypothetical protein
MPSVEETVVFALGCGRSELGLLFRGEVFGGIVLGSEEDNGAEGLLSIGVFQYLFKLICLQSWQFVMIFLL